MKHVIKMTWRTVRTFKGRYMALLLIVVLSAGFFAGLKVTTDAMIHTGDDYFAEKAFYDFRLISTLGFTEDDVVALGDLEGVKLAEGTRSVDALMTFEDATSPMKLYAVTEKTNLLTLTAGSMPTAPNQCLGDKDRFTEADIGKTIVLSSENDEATSESLAHETYTIVGLAVSPLHIGMDRGTTNIGSGAITAYLYMPAENFTAEVYTEVSLLLEEGAPIYSDEYETLIEDYQGDVSACAEDLAKARYEGLLETYHLTPELGSQFGILPPKVYCLTRNENAGYVSFENDTAIIDSVSNIFPVFFISIAILVCITTVSRMVDEERTQIGVLKAMGFSNRAIMAKYLLYAGTATFFGWIMGFFLCTWGLPEIFWLVYRVIYGFAPLKYYFSPGLAILTLAISFVSILGSTYLSCRKELVSVPAKLIRPRAAKIGKRILLERIKWLWNRLSFLQKITLRNMFRYKARMFMMLVGIGCCAGLIVTGFGLKDSMMHIGTMQYGEIQKYQLELSYETGTEDDIEEALASVEGIRDYLAVSTQRVDLSVEKQKCAASLISYDQAEGLLDFWYFEDGETPVSLPAVGEAIVNMKVADTLDLSVGDTLTLTDSDMETVQVKVSGIFDNYIYNYIFVSAETYEQLFGQWQTNSLLMQTESDTLDLTEDLTALGVFTSMTDLTVNENNISEALGCLNYILWLILFFSGALSFIVVYNLTNINIGERSREIATVQVLGFYPKETESYVLRENLVLSIIAGVLGMPVGILIHRIVMSVAVIDIFAFDICIKPLSFVWAFVVSVCFAVIVNFVMKGQIRKINMAESLKAVE